MVIPADLNAIHMVRIKDLKPRPNNRNHHPDDQIERLIKIIKAQGFRRPLIVSTRSGFIVCGHGRLEAAKRLGLSQVPVIYQNYESDEIEYADHIADNSLQLWSELDLSGINSDIGDLGPEFDIDLLGLKDFTVDVSEKGEGAEDNGGMMGQFGMAPFTILNARSGEWQERKRQWLSLGIQSELGRGGGGSK